MFRIIAPIFDPIKFIKGIWGYVWYLHDLAYMIQKTRNKVSFLLNLFPVLDEKTSQTRFDAHYFYNPIWAFSRIIKSKPKVHVDVASDHRLSGYLSRFIKTIFVDIRPIPTSLSNLKIISGSALKLPFKKNQLESLSCLHVIEHIGLGRYGDPLDIFGHRKAAVEFSRVLKKGGLMYIATPIGKERICFNAHRIFTPMQILELFPKFKLIEFSIVTDDDQYLENVNPTKFTNQNYACGLFLLKKI